MNLDNPQTAADITEKVSSILVKHFGSDQTRFAAEASIIKDLGMDSLDCIEIAMLVEDEFEIEVMDEDLGQIETVSDLTDLIISELAEKRR